MTAAVEVTGEHERQAAVDLDRLEEDATVGLGQLTEQRARLSLDALTDPRIATELDDVRSEIAGAGRALEQVALARAESGRRLAAAAADAEAKRREEALQKARALPASGTRREDLFSDAWVIRPSDESRSSIG